MRILVTGALGSIGAPLVPALRARGHEVTATDIDSLDVRERVREPRSSWLRIGVVPDVIVHLAGAKHAPDAELEPADTVRTNIVGTENVLAYADHIGARVITASTCKAADPETVYGATKLVAERMTLNAGGVVIRFYNVPESGGNVFRLWEQIPADQPIPVTDCCRYFISIDRAVELVISALHLPTGRWIADPGEPEWMRDVAARLYPGRPLTAIPRRRGDRRIEPLHAEAETVEPALGGLARIVGAHDPEMAVLKTALRAS